MAASIPSVTITSLPVHITTMAEKRTIEEDGYTFYRKLIPDELVRRARTAIDPKVEEWRRSSTDGTRMYDVISTWEEWPTECKDLYRELLVSCLTGKLRSLAYQRRKKSHTIISFRRKPSPASTWVFASTDRANGQVAHGRIHSSVKLGWTKWSIFKTDIQSIFGDLKTPILERWKRCPENLSCWRKEM